jgi:hypothetical protein
VKCGSVKKCRRKFHRKFSGNTLPSTRGIDEPIKKVRSIESLLVKKSARKRLVLTEERLDDIGTRLEHVTKRGIETPCTIDRHVEIVSSHSYEAA